MKTRGHSCSHRVTTQYRSIPPLHHPLPRGKFAVFDLRLMCIVNSCFVSVKCQPHAHLLFINKNSLQILQLIKLHYSECCLHKACCHNGRIQKNNKGLQTLKLDSFKTVSVYNVEEKQQTTCINEYRYKSSVFIANMLRVLNKVPGWPQTFCQF